MSEGRISAERYRELFGVVPAAVAVVSTATGSTPHATTVSAFGALSLEPPLVQVSLDMKSELLSRVRQSGLFLINVLAHEQEELARRFARSGHDDFAGIEWSSEHGQPRLTGCHGWLVAKVERIVEAGDHAILIGLALDSGVAPGLPLLYHDRAFRVMAPIDPGISA